MLFINRYSAMADANESLTDGKITSTTLVETTSVGIDIGTATIICGTTGGDKHVVRHEPNAFFSIPNTPRITAILCDHKVKHLQKNGKVYILGASAEAAADIFKQNTRRPVQSGLLNPREPEAIDIIMEILNDMIPQEHRDGVTLCFSVPADPVGRQGAVLYHEALLEMRLKALGFKPRSINEGLAVILSEAGSSDATALGISIGGGMCNVCFSYLGVPVITYSIQTGGDYIDEQVASVLNETATHVKLTKERSLNLSLAPATRIDTALHIYYNALFKTLIRSLREILGTSEATCRLPKSLPLFISGGTMLPPGSLETFKEAMHGIKLPIAFSDIILASNPAEATVRGAMNMATE